MQARPVHTECQQPTGTVGCYTLGTKVYLAADHGAFDFRNALLAYIQDELKMEVEDCGAFTMDPADDYPAIVAGAAEKLFAGSFAAPN